MIRFLFKPLLALAGIALFPTIIMAQGQFAGSMKSLVHKSYRTTRLLPDLEGFDFQEGSLISSVNDPEAVLVDVFNKGNTAVVFFSVLNDSTSHNYTIMDVVEVKDIQPGWEVRTAFCRQRGVSSSEIVAVVKTTNQEYLKTVREAWRFNLASRKFIPVNAKEVDCQQGW